MYLGRILVLIFQRLLHEKHRTRQIWVPNGQCCRTAEGQIKLQVTGCMLTFRQHAGSQNSQTLTQVPIWYICFNLKANKSVCFVSILWINEKKVCSQRSTFCTECCINRYWTVFPVPLAWHLLPPNRRHPKLFWHVVLGTLVNMDGNQGLLKWCTST